MQLSTRLLLVWKHSCQSTFIRHRKHEWMTDSNIYCPGLKPSRKLNPLKLPPFLLIDENTNEKLWDGIAIYWKITIITIVLIKECRKGRVFYPQKNIHPWSNKNASWRQQPVWFPRQRQNSNWPCTGHVVYGKRKLLCQGGSQPNFPPHPDWKLWKNKDETKPGGTWQGSETG